MLKIKQENIVDVFDSLTGIFDDINISLDKDGLKVNEADRSMVIFVDVKLKPSSFEEYDLDRQVNFSIGLTGLVSVLKRFDKEDKITLELSKDRLTLSNGNKYFKLPLLQSSEEEKPNVSKLEFKIDLSIKTNLFVEAIKDSSIFAESVVLDFKGKELLFKSQDGNGEYQKKVMIGDSDLTAVLNGKGSSRYSLEYLEKIFKKPFGDKINLKFGNDFPIKITFSEDNKEVSYILAPRVTEDEEVEVAKTKPSDDE